MKSRSPTALNENLAHWSAGLLRALGETVFISYGHRHRELASALADYLRKTGRVVFVDVQHIEFGQNWRERIGQALLAADSVLLLWSEQAAASRFVNEELMIARYVGKRIVPVVLDGARLPSWIRSFQRATFSAFGKLFSKFDMTREKKVFFLDTQSQNPYKAATSGFPAVGADVSVAEIDASF
jgi:hypothetical protein